MRSSSTIVRRYTTLVATRCLASLLGLVTCCVSIAIGQQIDSISPRGLTLGGSTVVNITGKGLGPTSRLMLGDIAIESTKISATDDRLQLRVAVSEGQPGIAPLRVVTQAGVSNPVMVGVDRLPQQPFADTIQSLPVAMHGELTGEQVLSTRFFAKQGETVAIELEGQRLGSKLRPLLRLFSPTGRQLVSARPDATLHGDTRAVLRVAQTGEYRIEFQDLLFKGPKPGWFRLKVGNFEYASGVFPMAVARRGQSRLEYVGSNIRSAAIVTEASKQRTLLDQLTISWDQDGLPRSGMTPCVRISDFGAREYTEASLSGSAVLPPFGINGRISEAGEQDEFKVKVQPESELSFELYADRWGSPLDATLKVLDAGGNSLLSSDDRDRTTDPGGVVKIPANAHEIVIQVSSVTGQGSAAHTYRIAVKDKESAAATLTLDRLNIDVPSGGRTVLPVAVKREGATPVSLQLPTELRGLVRVDADAIHPDDEQGLWSLTAAAGSRGVFVVRPRGYLGERGVSVPIATPSFPGASYQPALNEEALLRISPAGRVGVSIVPSAPAYLATGTRLPVDVYLERHAEVATPIRIALVTTQTKRTKKKDNKDVPAPEQELRLAEQVVIKRGDAAQVEIIVPNDLPLHSWAFAVRAEVLSDDEKTVLETATSRVHRLKTVQPLRITANLPDKQSVKAGETATLSGSIERHADYTFPVTVALEGVDGVTASVVVPMDSDRFELAYQVPADAAAAEHKSAVLVATPTKPSSHARDLRATTKAFTVQTIPAK